MSSILADLAPLLRTSRFGRVARWHPVTGSTNAEAARWVAEGAPEGALIGAEHQTAGRGRHGRTWADEPGQNLLVSLVLRPMLPADQFGLIPLAAGVAVAEALERVVSPLSLTLKWPNDVLLEGRKVGGLLLEGQLARPDGLGATLVLGLGLNVNQTSFPPDVAERATSLALEVGRPIPRLPLLADVLAALEAHYDRLASDGGASARQGFEARMAGRGAMASVAFPHSTRPAEQGAMLGIATSGALRFRVDGTERLLHAGEVTLQAHAQ